ncbi:hypothetical protein IT408_04400 [Candidatus Uhrbacteria bacterium]|nr:hypothetical protein [Candidatus Uhrbacteria bacterium]
MPDSPQQRIGSFTQGELQIASWWVQHRLELRRFGYGFIITICVLSWGYAFTGLLDAYVISYPRESRLMRQMAVNQQLLAELEGDRPEDVSLSEVSVLNSTADRMDLSVEVINPNPQWWGEFTYRFNLSGEETPLRKGYVLPSGKQILSELGYKPQTRGSRSAVISIDSIRWHRVDPMLTNGDYPAYYKNRFQINAESVRYDTSIAYNGKRVGQTNFTLVNSSAYGFWEVELLIRLYRGSTVSSIQTVKAQRVRPGERREMQVLWPDNLTGVTKTEVIPQANIMERSVFLDPNFFEKN